MTTGDPRDDKTATGALVPPVGARGWWLEEALRVDPGEPCPAAGGVS